MKIIRNRLLPPKNFDAINIMGLLFCHKSTIITPEIVRHEQIHTRQMAELLFVFFYLWYFMEWLVRLFMRGNAYHHISFEREAYDHMDEPDYLKRRKHFAVDEILQMGSSSFGLIVKASHDIAFSPITTKACHDWHAFFILISR